MPVTGFAHPKCYARSLGDCSSQITGEHFLSRSVLQELGGEAVILRGMPWQREEFRRIGVNSVTANVLCGRHNSALSGLDTTAVRFFRRLRRAETAVRTGDGTSEVALFPGIDIERWLLKCIMGLAAGHAVRTPEGAPIPWSPTPLWCRLLFGRVSFPSTWGLYVHGEAGRAMRLDPGRVTLTPMTASEDVSGCVVTLVGFDFTLAACDVTARRAGALNDASIHRPTEIVFADPPSHTTHSVCLAWSNKWVGEAIHTTWSPYLAESASN
jgi:hypothetical protein